MKTTINKNILKQVLNIVQRATGKNINLPILSSLFIESKKNYLELKATDLEHAILCKVLADNEKEGSVVCPARTLESTFSVFPSEKVLLQEEGNFLLIKSEGASIKIKTDNKENFPIIPRIKNKEKIVQIKAQALCEALSKVINFIGINSTKIEITGVYFNASNNVLKLVATDNFRLAEQKVYFEKENNLDFSFILPFKTARSFIDVFSKIDGVVDLVISENQVEFIFEDKSYQIFNIEIVSKLIEGEFPSYEKIIPVTFSTEAVFNKDEFLQRIQLASVFSSKINDVVFVFNVQNNKILIKSENQQTGEFEGELTADLSGKDIKIAFNYKFLIEGVNVFNTNEIFMGLNSEDEPVLFKSEKDKDFIYIIMPLKID
ncbi:DNA polymerase III subunit beta [bacterium HR34]|nr:DNA polymerase III subunit beta [bacterium HR34]